MNPYCLLATLWHDVELLGNEAYTSVISYTTMAAKGHSVSTSHKAAKATLPRQKTMSSTIWHIVTVRYPKQVGRSAPEPSHRCLTLTVT